MVEGHAVILGDMHFTTRRKNVGPLVLKAHVQISWDFMNNKHMKDMELVIALQFTTVLEGPELFGQEMNNAIFCILGSVYV